MKKTTNICESEIIIMMIGGIKCEGKILDV